MNDAEWNRLGRKRERLRKQGTLNPFCCVCGEHQWAVRYELHHIAGRKYDDRVIRLCHSCHDKASDMQKDYPPIPPGTDPSLARLIQMIRGRIIIMQLALDSDQELHDWMTGSIALPPLPKPGEDNHHDD